MKDSVIKFEHGLIILKWLSASLCLCVYLVRVSDEGKEKRKVVVEITPHSLRLLLLMHYWQIFGSHASTQRWVKLHPQLHLYVPASAHPFSWTMICVFFPWNVRKTERTTNWHEYSNNISQKITMAELPYKRCIIITNMVIEIHWKTSLAEIYQLSLI